MLDSKINRRTALKGLTFPIAAQMLLPHTATARTKNIPSAKRMRHHRGNAPHLFTEYEVELCTIIEPQEVEDSYYLTISPNHKEDAVTVPWDRERRICPTYQLSSRTNFSKERWTSEDIFNAEEYVRTHIDNQKWLDEWLIILAERIGVHGVYVKSNDVGQLAEIFEESCGERPTHLYTSRFVRLENIPDDVTVIRNADFDPKKGWIWRYIHRHEVGTWGFANTDYYPFNGVMLRDTGHRHRAIVDPLVILHDPNGWKSWIDKEMYAWTGVATYSSQPRAMRCFFDGHGNKLYEDYPNCELS